VRELPCVRQGERSVALDDGPDAAGSRVPLRHGGRVVGFAAREQDVSRTDGAVVPFSGELN
jgi:hypothetical protein